MSETEKIIVVIPAYNEEANLPSVLKRAAEALPGADLLVINDGSRDRTSRVARSHGARVVDLPFNLGIGAAVETGYKYAYHHGYDLVVRVDGDGQHTPEEIPALLEPIRAGELDFAVGSRFLGKGDAIGSTTLPRRMGIRIFSRFVTSLVGKPFTDPTSGFRAFNRRTLHAFMAEYPVEFPEVETIFYLHRKGLRIGEVSVSMSPRPSGKSSINFWSAVYYMYKVTFALLILTIRSYRNTVSTKGGDR